MAANISSFITSTISRKKFLTYSNSGEPVTVRVSCSTSEGRGFGAELSKKKVSSKIPKESSDSSGTRNFSSSKPMLGSRGAPQLNRGFEVEDKLGKTVSDRQFLEKLELVRRSTLAQKKAEVDKFSQAIDYDTPLEEEKSKIGFGAKVGVGIAVVVFGTVFAFGDFLPSPSMNTNKAIVEKKLAAGEKSILQSRLEEFEAVLQNSPDDLSAVEGAAVTSAELGEYEKSSSFLEKLTKERPTDPEAYRLLGDVKFQLKEYDDSAESYRKSFLASGKTSFEALRGITNALLAARKPEEAVKVLLSYNNDHAKANQDEPNVAEGEGERSIDPVQIQLLLGKAYSDWGHVSDAVAVYDQLISKHRTDFRGYLAKGIILKENGNTGDAERMFIQARFFAPDKAKPLVDQYART